MVALLFLLSITKEPERVHYGVSFNTLYARELSLDPRETYLAILDELHVRRIRLAAHWPMIEPDEGEYDFNELDFQIKEAEQRGVSAILAIGRRLPRWPECHVPEWAEGMPWEAQKEALKKYLTAVVNRYKDSPAVQYWQVENEPFLEVFAYEECGALDKAFLEEEIKLVRSLDPTHEILITDSGNLGTWAGAYSRGDLFGTSVYVYLWNPNVGPFKSILPPAYYRIKQNLVRLLFGQKKIILIELSAEPWLLNPVVNTPIDVQLGRMDVEKFEDIIDYARQTNLAEQYLWGAEWWYWLKVRGSSDMWERARDLYQVESVSVID